MTTNDYTKCSKCGRYDLKRFVQDDWIDVYCPHCQKLVVAERVNKFLSRLIESEVQDDK